MAVNLAALIPAQYVPSAVLNLYQAPAGVSARIDSLSISNPGTVAATVTLYIVPSGATAGASNASTNAQAVLPGQTWNSPNEAGKVLRQGDAIWGISNTGTALVILASGIVATPS